MATTKKPKEEKPSTLESMKMKMGDLTPLHVLRGQVQGYSREEFLKDMEKLRGEYKRRRGEYEKLNNEIIQELNLDIGTYELKGLNFNISNQSLIQQSKLRTTNRRNMDESKGKGHKGEYTEMRMSLDFKKAADIDILTVWNSLEDTMKPDKDGRISVLAGIGGIYEQQAKFLNRFLNEDEQIKTNKKALTRNTNKGIRTDIKNAFKKIQERLDNPQDILKLNDFWDNYRAFKDRVQNDINLDYSEGAEEGRKLLRDFTKAWMKSGLNLDTVMTEYKKALNDGTISSMNDLSKLDDLITRLQTVNDKIDEKKDETKETTNQQIDDSSTSETIIKQEEKDPEEIARENEIEAYKREIQSLKKKITQQQTQINDLTASVNNLIATIKQTNNLQFNDLTNTTTKTDIQTIKSSTSTNRTVKANTTKGIKKKQQKETKGLKK